MITDSTKIISLLSDCDESMFKYLSGKSVILVQRSTSASSVLTHQRLHQSQQQLVSQTKPITESASRQSYSQMGQPKLISPLPYQQVYNPEIPSHQQYVQSYQSIYTTPSSVQYQRLVPEVHQVSH